jgi:hypothetical protein
VDKSLVVVEEAEGALRYGMLTMVRRFARERLVEWGELDPTDRATGRTSTLADGE